MLKALSFFRGIFKVQSIKIDGSVFKLHYRLTAVLLLVFWVLMTSKQFFGKPMDCYFPDLPTMSLNTYCLIHSTFLVEPSSNDHPARQKLLHPGLSGHTEKDELKFYGYYQWICIILFVQGMFFYMPHYLWKTWEGGKMKMLVLDLAFPLTREDSIERNAGLLVEYLQKQLHSHNSYMYKYYICEFLNLLNILAQISFMNGFLGEDFKYYGLHVIFFNWAKGLQEITNPVQRLFPTVTKCSFKKFGPSGSIEVRDGMCILARNAVNQKMYLFLWFWFHILAALSALVIVWRILTLLYSPIRLHKLRPVNAMNSTIDINDLYNKLWIGDWFVLIKLKENIDPLLYKEVIFRLARSCVSTQCSACREPLLQPYTICTEV